MGTCRIVNYQFDVEKPPFCRSFSGENSLAFPQLTGIGRLRLWEAFTSLGNVFLSFPQPRLGFLDLSGSFLDLIWQVASMVH